MLKNSFDIRVVRLIKSTEANPLKNYLSQLGESSSTFVCLGHFDIIVIEKLLVKNDETPLVAVQEDSQRIYMYSPNTSPDTVNPFTQAIENNYMYPLYAIKQLDENRKVEADAGNQRSDIMDEFWQICSNYTVVTRLHCERECNTEKEQFTSILSNRLKQIYNLESGDHSAHMCFTVLHEEAFPVNVAFYDSLELGDVVGFIKCDSLSTILQVQRSLYEAPCVSDAYTYCGVNISLCKDEVEPNQKELLEKKTLDYISTRFSVKQAKYAEEVYPVLLGSNYNESDQHFFVTGNVDAVIDWRNRSETFLLEIINKLVWIDKYTSEGNCTNIMYRAFNDIITRVGLKHTPPKNSRPLEYGKEIGYVKVECPETIEALLIDPKITVRWKYPLAKLLGTLQTMSNNCVMDDLANLLIPGVNAILKRIAYHIKANKPINEEELLSFFDSCTSFANDILHLENQLVQHPELMPVRYFIPAIVLGFEQKFISECAYAIEQLDDSLAEYGRRNRRFQPIIFPSCEENTSTQCYLDHIADRDYQDNTALGIFVPVHNLYQPWKILHILCHEVAHYCGNDLRERKYRLQCITNSAAEYVLQLWDAYFHFDFAIEKLDAINKTRQKLSVAIWDTYTKKSANESEYLSQIERYLPSCTVRVASNREWQEQYQNDFLKSSSVMEQLSYITKLDTLNSMYGGSSLHELYAIHLRNCILSHYKECYADIMMILFLDCKFNDYYNCVFAQECLNISKNQTSVLSDNEKTWFEYHTDRLAFVCISISSIEKYSGWMKDRVRLANNTSVAWADIAIKKIQKWEENDPNTPKWHRQFIPEKKSNPYNICGYEAAQLISYLKHCAKKIDTQVRKNDDIQRLRDMLAKLSAEQFNWNCIREYLENG